MTQNSHQFSHGPDAAGAGRGSAASWRLTSPIYQQGDGGLFNEESS